jgi:hypothetical protein
MNSFVKNILATIIAAAIVADVACLWQFNTRLSRIETKLEILLPEHSPVTTNNKPEHELRSNQLVSQNHP